MEGTGTDHAAGKNAVGAKRDGVDAHGVGASDGDSSSVNNSTSASADSSGTAGGEKHAEIANDASSKTVLSFEMPSVDDKPEQHGITDELVQKFLERFLPADAQFHIKGYSYRPLASLGEGYTTARKVLDVTYQDEKSGKEETAAFVVKLPCGNFAGFVREMGLYEREVIMYSQVTEHFRQILSQRGKQVLLPFPRFVYGSMVLNGQVLDDTGHPTADQTPREKLVLELLTDYQVIDKQAGLDMEHLRLVMPALARFHAVGCVLRERDSEKADRLRQVNSQMPADMDKMSNVLAPCCAALEHEGLMDEANTISKLLMYDSYRKSYEETFTEDRDAVTLVHGDLWSSNMMFKYRTDEEGVRHPESIRFVDLQMCQFGDLAYDLIYCLLTSTLRETRREHLRELLTWYEEAFRSQLEELGENASQLTPWLSVDNLLAMYGNALHRNFAMPLMVVQLLFSSDEDKADMMSATNVDNAVENYNKIKDRWRNGGCPPALRDRLIGLVDDMREFGHF